MSVSSVPVSSVLSLPITVNVPPQPFGSVLEVLSWLREQGTEGQDGLEGWTPLKSQLLQTPQESFSCSNVPFPVVSQAKIQVAIFLFLNR